MATSLSSARPQRPAKTVLLAGLVAGLLDISAAHLVYVVILHRTTIMRLLQGIASGVFGRRAFEGGYTMALCGLGIHFFIALVFALLYYLILPFLPIFQRNRIAAGVIYGLFVWIVMNIAVLPLFKMGSIPQKWEAIARGAGILVVCVGLPISLIIGHYYQQKHSH